MPFRCIFRQDWNLGTFSNDFHEKTIGLWAARGASMKKHDLRQFPFKSAPPVPWVVYFSLLVGGLEQFLCFHILGIVTPTNHHIFQRGWNHQSDSNCFLMSITVSTNQQQEPPFMVKSSFVFGTAHPVICRARNFLEIPVSVNMYPSDQHTLPIINPGSGITHFFCRI